ncbi:hypothetical protein [Paenibacillus sp. MBLB4367]|uniref:hypothetical protein n=1 Tax=Paenibacillus sp. MBLB4367 TaxID=3384767 RepID=UPI00390844F3
MNFKPIDLQLAVHKNGDAAHWQNQMQQKPVLDQAAAAGAMQKDAELNRSRSEKSESAAKANIRDERKRSRPDRQTTESNRQPGESEGAPQSCEHPYKGHRIDLSL